MKVQSNSYTSWATGRIGFVFIALCLLTGMFGNAAGQNNSSTSNKADQNVKSSARVNPSTLAMELSIPIISYPGRGGNSKPFILNYSSKVWNMKMFNTRSHQEQVSNQNYSSLVYQSTEIRPNFAERSAAGWTSSLQPAIIYSEPLSEVYNEFGGLYTGQVPGGLLSLSNLSGGSDGCYWSEPELVYNVTCGGLAWHSLYRCPGNDGSPHTDAENYECVTGGSIFNPGGPGPWNPANPLPTTYVPQTPYVVKRINVMTPDGVTHELRKSDKAYNCNTEPTECYDANSFYGTYLAVDGSGMRLVMGQSQFGEMRDVLYFPDGGKYLFTPYTQPNQPPSTTPEKFVDADGNESIYGFDGKWIDTLGREIKNPFSSPFPHTPGTQDLQVKGLNNQAMPYSLSWDKLEDVLEHSQTQTLPAGADKCTTPVGDPVSGPHLFNNQTPGYLDDQVVNGTRFMTFYRTCAGRDASGNALDFNPVVISEINLPNGQKYVFKYNEYGEITKITYPTGGYERFEYGYVNPIGFSALDVYQQGNRGVLKRYVSFNGTTDDQVWTYQQQSPIVKTIAPDGTSIEKDIFEGYSSGFGFEDPRNGMVKEERVKDSNGVLRSRTINDWINTAPRDGGVGERDPRLKRSVTITFEPNSSAALATLSETDYDDSGSTDPKYFSHLNVKRQKSYHYAVISNKTTVDNEALEWPTITGWFSGKLASISEVDYFYDSNYLARGFTSLRFETRLLDPSNQTTVLSRVRNYYDNWMYDETGTAGHWADPQSSLRGKLTLTKTLFKDPISGTETEIETSAQYDKFGNLRKIWDAAGNMIETQYSSDYEYAYPTKVIAPAPDPGPNNSGHGTDQTSSAETTYDLTTGLVLSVKDDYGQITETEYNDLMLRPTRTFASNFDAPQSQIIYDDDAHTVKVRKQIDETNWDEATTYMDAAGRTLRTEAKDSQGDVIVNTHYDLMGRVDCVTNPYRSGEAAYWNKTRFDEIGRAVESYAPIAVSLCQTTQQNLQSLGTTSFDISTVANYEGTVVISTDASLRKGRSITNALGQLVRVDEPTAFGGTVTADLGAIDTPLQPTYYTYSKLGQMVKVQQGKAGETIQYRYFLYDNLGRLLRVKQPEQEANTGLSAYTDPITGNSSWSAAFTYDVTGNVLTATDAKGTKITNDYDNAGRVKTRSYSNEPSGITTPPVNYFYDGKGLSGTANFAKGKLTKISSSVSETRYTNFDHMGRVLSSEQVTDGQTYPMGYKYNLSGALTEETYPSGEIVRNFLESDGDLSRVAVSGHTYISDLSYTAAGGISVLKLGNGTWETAQFNSRQQITQLGLGTASNNTGLWKVNYEYGELQSNESVDLAKNTGSIAKQTLTVPNASFVQIYKYDSLYRLTEAKEPNGTGNNWSQTFGYDRFGNRTSFNQTVGTTNTTQTPAINANTNRFSSSSYQYDKNGNVTIDAQNWQYVFNGDNKQIAVKDGNGTIIGQYYYDGEGKRVKKFVQSNQETTIFVYSSGKLIAEYSSQAPSNPTISYTTSDHLGSPRVITDKNGNVTSRRDFMPFGEDLNSGVGNRSTTLKYALAGADNLRKRFTGYEKDAETGLDFAEARYYNNKHGRFTAVDPLLASGKSANPQTFNRYIYCSNNPLACTDPTGLDGIWTYYTNSSGGQSYKQFNSQKEIDDANKLNDTEICKQHAGACATYKVWTGGNWVLWDDRKVGRLGDNGQIERVSLLGIGTDEQWKQLVSDWYDGKGFSEAWQKSFAVAMENEGTTGVDNVNYALGGARRIQDDGGVQSMIHAAPFVLPLSGLSINFGTTGRNTTALATMEDAYGANGVVRQIGNYEVAGTFGRVGNTYNANIWGMFRSPATGQSGGMFSFVRSLENEARASGATRMNILGTHIMNPNFLNPSNIQRASRLGMDFRQVNSSTVLFTKQLK